MIYPLPIVFFLNAFDEGSNVRVVTKKDVGMTQLESCKKFVNTIDPCNRFFNVIDYDATFKVGEGLVQ